MHAKLAKLGLEAWEQEESCQWLIYDEIEMGIDGIEFWVIWQVKIYLKSVFWKLNFKASQAIMQIPKIQLSIAIMILPTK